MKWKKLKTVDPFLIMYNVKKKYMKKTTFEKDKAFISINISQLSHFCPDIDINLYKFATFK